MKEDNKGYNGIYRAVVISNDDELEMGRIRIRIPFLHGTNTTDNTSRCIADDKLPYAYPCAIFAAQDSGMFLVPEVGTVVFIMFENGNPTKPLYIGQMFSKGREDVDEYYNPNKQAFTDSENMRVKKAGVDDTPLESYKGGTYKKYTLFKTPKGSTIEFTDEDEGECLSVFDRLGQSFAMYSPATAEYSSNGINTRGVFNVLKEKFKQTIELTSIIILKTLCGSFLRMVSKEESSATDLVTVYNDENAGIHIDIGSDDRILIFYKEEAKIELTAEGINIVSEGTINLDAETINMNASSITTSTEIHVGGASSVDVQDYVDTNEESTIG